MFKFYPTLFPSDLVELTKPISRSKNSSNKRQKLKRKAQMVMQKIRAGQPLSMPSYTVNQNKGVDWVYFNYADQKKVEYPP